MSRTFRCLFALFLGACSVPHFEFSPEDACVTQQQAGRLCGGSCSPCADGQTCQVASDCTSAVCEANVCTTAPSCSDKLVNGAETDTDCGGGTCSACPLEAHCTRASDCTSQLCELGVCVAVPTCGDKQINGTETDTDCGGGSCPTCALDARCTRASDCASGLCKAGTCATPAADPACTDHQKNGSETDIDCGGTCNPCAVDKRCLVAVDCVTLVCAEVCQPAGCNDKVRNGSETDTDCGSSCAACDVGLVCKQSSDCKSLSCNQGHCVADTCSDNIQNGSETGKDCGGAVCGACAAGQGCSKASDCASLVCAANKTCSAASCSDKVKNGTESEVDCGKGCPGCQVGQFCNSGLDCASGVCTQSDCVPAAPSGGSLDTTGWVATASNTYGGDAPTTALSLASAIDGSNNTRWSSGYPQYSGMYFQIDMKQPQYFFGVTMDTQDQADDFPDLYDVYLSNDGVFTNASIPVIKSATGSALAQLPFPGTQALVARFIRIVVTASKPSKWWGIRELTVRD